MRLDRHPECGDSVCLPASGSPGLALIRGAVILPIGCSRETNSELVSCLNLLLTDKKERNNERMRNRAGPTGRSRRRPKTTRTRRIGFGTTGPTGRSRRRPKTTRSRRSTGTGNGSRGATPRSEISRRGMLLRNRRSAKNADSLSI